MTDETALKLRAEDGRSIKDVDISMFINDLPNGKDTEHFSTPDASGSTSQAAGVIEGIEAGTRLFLIDEDTSATNFMVRDALMQAVICREKEPITPFIERIRQLYEEMGISTILVAGSSGAFFYVADYVLQMDCYHAVDITQKVKKLCEEHIAEKGEGRPFRLPKFERYWGQEHKERLGKRQDRQGAYHDRMKIKTFGKDGFSVNKEMVDIRYVEQVADAEQTNGLAQLLRYVMEHCGQKKTVRETANELEKLLEKEGWKPFCSGYVASGLARPRRQDIFAVLNRFRE